MDELNLIENLGAAGILGLLMIYLIKDVIVPLVKGRNGQDRRIPKFSTDDPVELENLIKTIEESTAAALRLVDEIRRDRTVKGGRDESTID